jgi:hypothetical protein
LTHVSIAKVAYDDIAWRLRVPLEVGDQYGMTGP